MTDARQQILQAVRTALGPAHDAPSIAAEAEALLQAPERIRPRLSNVPLVDVFSERLSQPRMGATVERASGLAAFPAAVRRYMDAHGLEHEAALQPALELRDLDWSGIELCQSIRPDEQVGIGLARWGIAENGSLVFHSGPETPILFNFLPLHHVVAVRADSILAYTEDYAAAAAEGTPPRNVNLITGASGTTDIEGSYVRGAHGPAFLHVVIFGGPA